MSTSDLFRAEVLVAPSQQYGRVFLNTPINVRVVTIVGVLLLLCVIFFIFFFEFAETCDIQGVLVPDQGMIRVYSQKSGVVIRRYVNAGDTVKKGESLFLMDISSEGYNSKDAQHRLYMYRQNQQELSDAILEKTQHLHNLSKLLTNKHIPLVVYQATKDELRLLHETARAAQLKRIAEEKSHFWLLRASVDGVVTDVELQAGDTLSPNICAATILPQHSQLLVELYTLMPQLRFLKNQLPVILRYDAFPHPDGGTARATIVSLGFSVHTDQDEKKAIQIGAPYYKAIATLEHQDILFGGELRKLQPGMTLRATVYGARKKIWQWLLGPLYVKVRESLT